MRAEPRDPRVAQPGDPDLDADLDGLTITAVVTNDDSRELLVRWAGGYGHWTNTSGDVDVFEPGHPTDRVKDGELRGWFPSMPDKVWAAYVDQLQRWRDRSVPIRMTSAPGRVTMLIEDRDTHLPFPRRWPPGQPTT